MKQLQLLTSEYTDKNGLPLWRSKGIEISSHNDWKTIDKSIPVLCY